MAYNDDHVVMFRFQPEVTPLNLYDIVYTAMLHSALVVGDKKTEEKQNDATRYGGKKIWVCIVTLMKEVAPLLLDLNVFNTTAVAAFTGAVTNQTTQFHHKLFHYCSHLVKQSPTGERAAAIATALDSKVFSLNHPALVLYGVYVKGWVDCLVRKERKKPEKVHKVLTCLEAFLADLQDAALVAWERESKKIVCKYNER
jgi:hypothetical protein